ncbi:MAG: cytochrome P450 [Acidimicrobiales bacterium]|nr:cytochrome P450 [Acidimicrobiales bacterium]
MVDFDHHSQEHVEHRDEMYRDLRERCPVAWTNAHDGYWVLSTQEHASALLRDHEHFVSGRHQDEDGRWHGGDSIPDPQLPPYLLLENDPPIWGFYRRLLNPWLAPAKVAARQARLEELSTRLLDEVIERGSFDLILDYANPIPGVMTLDLVGQHVEDWQRWAEPHHAAIYTEPGSEEYMEAVAGILWQREQLIEAMRERRGEPGDDLLTALATARTDDGEPLGLEEAVGILMTIIGGGVDTTTATTANGLLYLQRHPEARAWLLEDLDDRLPQACEEILRYFPPVLGVARTVAADVDFADQKFAAGERVLASVTSANRDRRVFEDPDAVRLDRVNNRHLSFGAGIHRCVGSHAARAMLHTMVGDVLRRLPDYTIDEDKAVRYGPNSVVDGWISVPVHFTPGRRLGASSWSSWRAMNLRPATF